MLSGKYNNFMKTLILVFCCLAISSAAYSSYIEINEYIESTETDIPRDIIRAIAWVESYWNQVDPEGEPFRHINTNGSSDWGVMQINDETLDKTWDLEKVKTSTKYNILVGIRILEWKLSIAPRIRKKYQIKEKTDLQIAIKLYNGWIRSWKYLEAVERALELQPWKNHLRR